MSNVNAVSTKDNSLMKQEKLAIFDFDGTLFPEETLPYLLKQYGRLGYSKSRLIVVYSRIIPRVIFYKATKVFGKFGYDKESFRRGAFRDFLQLFKGMDQEGVQLFFDRNLEDVMQALNGRVVNELKKYQQAGYKIILLSGCFSQLLDKVAQKLDADESIGTMLHYTHKGNRKVLDINKKIDIITGKRKAAVIKKTSYQVDWNNSIAYADSYYDSAVMELCGKAVCVNPDKKLSMIAVDKKWDVLLTDKV